MERRSYDTRNRLTNLGVAKASLQLAGQQNTARVWGTRRLF
jgi:hypothetical protein